MSSNQRYRTVSVNTLTYSTKFSLLLYMVFSFILWCVRLRAYICFGMIPFQPESFLIMNSSICLLAINNINSALCMTSPKTRTPHDENIFIHINIYIYSLNIYVVYKLCCRFNVVCGCGYCSFLWHKNRSPPTHSPSALQQWVAMWRPTQLRRQINQTSLY